MAISYQTLIWLRWPWNTGLRCAPPMVILRGFAGCAGLIPSRPKGRAGTRVIRIHTRAENTVSTVSIVRDNDHDPRANQPRLRQLVQSATRAVNPGPRSPT